jgi:hypothetical protein
MSFQSSTDLRNESRGGFGNIFGRNLLFSLLFLKGNLVLHIPVAGLELCHFTATWSVDIDLWINAHKQSLGTFRRRLGNQVRKVLLLNLDAARAGEVLVVLPKNPTPPVVINRITSSVSNSTFKSTETLVRSMVSWADISVSPKIYADATLHCLGIPNHDHRDSSYGRPSHNRLGSTAEVAIGQLDHR